MLLASLVEALPAGTGEETTLPIDPEGDGVDLAEDNCPSLATPLTTDQDGDGVGDQCDRWFSPQPPRGMLEQSLALATNAGVVLPACAASAFGESAWGTELLLDDRRGRRAFSCAVRVYRRLAGTAGNPLATQAKLLLAQALAALGEEAVAALLGLGIDPASENMIRAAALADQGVGLLANNDPKGAADLQKARNLTEKSDRRDHTIADVFVKLLAGSTRVQTKTIANETWKGCFATIYFRSLDAGLACDEIVFLQANKITDATGQPVSATDQAAGGQRRSAKGWKVDRVDGKKSPFFGINDDGSVDPKGTTKGKTSPTTPAALYDGPCVPGAEKYCFESCAVCKTGAAANRLLGCVKWGCELKNGKMVLKDENSDDTPSAEFDGAVAAWNAAVATAGNANFGRDAIPALTPWKSK